MDTMLKILQRSVLKIGRILFLPTVVLCVAIAAGLFTLRYWILPDIEKYHDEVTSLASKAVGLQIKIGKIEADLRWFRPHLVFTNVQLLDAEGHSALELRRIDNVVSWMTLLSGELRLQTLEVDDPDLLIRRDKQGVLHVAGLQVSGQSSDGKLSDWLLHQSRIILNNGKVTWQDDLYDRPTLVLNQAQMRFDNSGKHHRFAVSFAPPATVAAPLNARGDLVGDSFSDWSGWSGELFAEINQVNLDTWSAWINLPDEFSHAKGSLHAWLGIEGGRINRVTADMDMSEIRSRMAADLPQLNLAGLHGRIGWHELERGFEVTTSKLALQMSNGFKLQPTDFHLRLAGEKENPFATGEIQANAIELGDLSIMADYIPLGKTFKQKLLDFSPLGHIADLRAQWLGGGRFEVEARFDNMSMRRVGQLPGVEGLSGQIKGNDSSGVLSLNAPNLKLDAPQFLLEPVTFDKFSAQADWQHKRDDWDIKLNNFSVSNADLSGTANGNYQTDGKGPGVANINLDMTRISLHHIAKYLPKELMGQGVMTWLQQSLLGGEANDAHMRLHGDLNEFPFAKNKNGLFLIEAKSSGVVVDYGKEWPRVENALGNLRIEAGRLQVESTSATIAGIRVQKVGVTIPDFMAAEPQVQIRGEANLETKRLLDFIKHSPIRGYSGGFTDNTTAVGDGKLDVQLDIPLSDKPIKLSGNYHFNENEIDLDKYIPLAKNVTGDLKFTESVLQAKSIGAQIFGGPATLDIQTDAKGVLKVNLQGKIKADTWRKVDATPWVQSLSGETDWNTEVTVQNKQFELQAGSSLQGLVSNLPAPFSKKARELIPLKFEFKSLNATKDLMSVQCGNIVSVRLLRVEDKLGRRPFKRGTVTFGSARRLANKDGIWVTGSLPLLSVEGWNRVWPNDSGNGASMPVIDDVDLTVQKTIGYSTTINGLHIHARNHGDTITAQLTSKELNGGAIWYSKGNGRLVARLKNAAVANDIKDKETETVQAATNSGTEKVVRNFSMPALDVAVENFTYQGKQLGQLEMHASQIKKEILLDHFRLANPDGVLTVNGKWGLSPAQTHIEAKLELFDTGKMLNRSGYPNTLKDGNGTLDCDLVWPGSPDELKLANLNGHVNLKMSKGQFLKVDPGAGKLLSVMNLQSLPKHIALDFTDVFGKGFEFDTIAGIAQIRQGVMMTNDFKINGSAAQVTLSGQADLTRETQNLRVKVLPAIGNSVSLLAFAAGPAVGAGVFLANKLFRNPLDKLVSFEYNVTGSWVDPKVEKVDQVNATPNNSLNN
jgi:uncharacterized protein (TIGR02099 family)